MTQVAEGTVLLSPKAEEHVKEASPASRLPALSGAAITVVNSLNNQESTNADLFIRHLSEILLREGAGQVFTVKKESAGKDMTDETMAHVTSQSQGVVILAGD